MLFTKNFTILLAFILSFINFVAVAQVEINIDSSQDSSYAIPTDLNLTTGNLNIENSVILLKTITAKQEPSVNIPALDNATSNIKIEESTIINKTLTAKQAPSDNIPTTVNMTFNTKSEKKPVVINKILNASQQLSDITPSLEEVDSDIKGNDDLKTK